MVRKVYNFQTRLVQFSKAKKVLNSWHWSFHKWLYWTVSNIGNALAGGHVQSKLDNLRTLIIQSTDQQKLAKQVTNSWN